MTGMATFFAKKIIEAISLPGKSPYYVSGEDVIPDNIWLGAADDVLLRKRGVEFLDGTAPGSPRYSAQRRLRKSPLILPMNCSKKPVCFYVAVKTAAIVFGRATG